MESILWNLHRCPIPSCLITTKFAFVLTTIISKLTRRETTPAVVVIGPRMGIMPQL